MKEAQAKIESQKQKRLEETIRIKEKLLSDEAKRIKK